MDPLLANAERILEAAENCARANASPEGWAILLDSGGAIRMVAASGWALEALRRERGAEMAFQVQHGAGRVAVEARSISRSCRLESETPAAVARRLLNDRAAYVVTATRPLLEA